MADIADGWLDVTIGDLIELQRGIDITKKEQRPGHVPVVSSGGISSFHDTAAVNGPGVVIGRKGTLGKVFFLENDYWPHDTTLWVRNFRGNDPKFIYYLLESMDLKQLDVGSANPTLNRNHVHPIPVVVPPLGEQRAISNVLGMLDDKIESNYRIEGVALKLIAAKFEMEESLSAKRVPLSSLIYLERGREPGRDMCREDGVGTPFIRVSNLKMESHRGLTLSDFDGPLAKPDDVLISFDGTPGRVGFGLYGYFSSGVRRACAVDNPIPPSLTWAILSGNSVQGVISEYTTGTTIQHAGSALPFLSVPLLSASGLSWFENEGENLWGYLLSLRCSSETLVSLRNTLLLELLSGRLRVKDAESMMENL